jgi:large subunit ribosomal protein L30
VSSRTGAGREQAGTVLVTQVRSAIGTKPKHRGTLRALGLGRIGKSRVHRDGPEVRGMVQRVPHLVKVERVAPGDEGGRDDRAGREDRSGQEDTSSGQDMAGQEDREG